MTSRNANSSIFIVSLSLGLHRLDLKCDLNTFVQGSFTTLLKRGVKTSAMGSDHAKFNPNRRKLQVAAYHSILTQHECFSMCRGIVLDENHVILNMQLMHHRTIHFKCLIITARRTMN